MNKTEIIRALYNLSVDDLRAINKVVVVRIDGAAQDKKYEFARGDFVQFADKRFPGHKVKAKVVKLMTKNVLCITPEGQEWRVNPLLLEPWDGITLGQKWDGAVKKVGYSPYKF